MEGLKNDATKLEVIKMKSRKISSKKIGEKLGLGKSTIDDFLRKESHKDFWENLEGAGVEDFKENEALDGINVLTLDIETAPLSGLFWSIWNQNIPISRIKTDWYIIAWAAKWLNQDTVYYEDKRDSWDDNSDETILENIWKLMDEADIIITQNGKKFDERKLNSRFLANGLGPPSPYRHIDTLEVAKKYFGETSNKLEYLTNKYCKKYKKLKHQKFPGNELWDECLKGTMEAWSEMEEYNIHDVLSLEELYTIFRPYIKNHPNINVYHDSLAVRCSCGSSEFEHKGYYYTNLSKFDKFVCTSCGASSRGRVNLLSKEKRQSLRGIIT